MVASVEGEVKVVATVAAAGEEVFNAAILSSMELELPTVFTSFGDGVFFTFSAIIDKADLSESKLFDRSLLGVLVADSEPVKVDDDTADEDEEDEDTDAIDEDTKDGAGLSEAAFRAANFSAILLVLFGLDVAVFEEVGTDGGDGVDFSRAILSFTDRGVDDASDILLLSLLLVACVYFPKYQVTCKNRHYKNHHYSASSWLHLRYE